MAGRRTSLWVGGIVLVIAVWLAVWLPAEHEAPAPPGPPPRGAVEPGAEPAAGPGADRPAPAPAASPSPSPGTAGTPELPAPVPRPASPPADLPAAPAPDPRPLIQPLTPEAARAEEPEDEPLTALVFAPDRDGIQGAVREALPSIQDCYENWLEADRALGGSLKVRFTIEAARWSSEARVTSASLVSSTLDHPFLEGCVLNAMQSLRFDPPDGGRLDVTYPLRFEADEGSLRRPGGGSPRP